MIATNARAMQVVVHSRRRKNPVLHHTSCRGRLLGNENQPMPKSQNCHAPPIFGSSPQLSLPKGSYHLNEVRRNINLDLDGIPATLLAKVVLEHVTAGLLR